MVLGCYFLTKAPDEFAEGKAWRLRRHGRGRDARCCTSGQASHPDPLLVEAPTSRRRASGARRRSAACCSTRSCRRKLQFMQRDDEEEGVSSWSSSQFRELPGCLTVEFLDRLKDFGFGYATRGGISIGIEDLHIPTPKADAHRRRPKTRRAVPEGVPDGLDHQRRALQQGDRHLDARQQRHRRRDGQGDERVQGGLQPGLHDVRFRLPRLARPDPPAGRHARPDGQAAEEADRRHRRNHREPDHVELPRRPVGARVLHLDARRAARAWPTRRSRPPTPGTSPAAWWTWRRTSRSPRRIAARAGPRDQRR